MTGFVLALLCACSGPPAGVQEFQTKTDTAVLRGLVPLNEAPRSSAEVLLMTTYPQWVYITGAEVRVVTEGNSALTPEKANRLLHSASLTWGDPDRHNFLARWSKPANPFLFWFCPEAMKVDLPAGYGVPHRSNESLMLIAQWASEDLYLKETSLRLELKVRFTASQGTHPVRPIPLSALSLVDGKVPYFGVSEPNPAVHGPGCVTSEKIAGYPILQDQFGRSFQTIWRLTRGQNSSSTLVDGEMIFPAVVRAAAACAPSGLETMEVRDRTANLAVFSFPAGKPFVEQTLPPDHHYELNCKFKDQAGMFGSGTVILYQDTPPIGAAR